MICIQLTSLVALHPQPAPVFTWKRLSLAVASAAAEVAEREKFEGEPSCVTPLVSDLARPLPLMVIDPLREGRHGLALTLNGTVALVMPPADCDGICSQGPALLATAQAQLAVTFTAPVPPLTEKFCDAGEKLKLQ